MLEGRLWQWSLFCVRWSAPWRPTLERSNRSVVVNHCTHTRSVLLLHTLLITLKSVGELVVQERAGMQWTGVSDQLVVRTAE